MTETNAAAATVAINKVFVRFDGELGAITSRLSRASILLAGSFLLNTYLQIPSQPTFNVYVTAHLGALFSRRTL